MFGRLYRRLLRTLRPSAKERAPTFSDHVVEISFAAHSYEIWARFLCEPAGAVFLTCQGEFVDRNTVAVQDHLPVAEALEWLAEHRYDLASRQNVGRIAEMRLQHQDRIYKLQFHRGDRVLAKNPVNLLIDRCALHLPVLAGDPAPDGPGS